MGSALNCHYLYNWIKLPEGCLREFRNITVCSDYLCDGIPDSLFEENNSKNLTITHNRLVKTYYNIKHEGAVKINVFELRHPYEPLKGIREVKSLLATSLCTLWDSHPCREFITENINTRGIEYIARYQYIVHGVYNKQSPFQHITINIVWEIKFESQELTKHLPSETI